MNTLSFRHFFGTLCLVFCGISQGIFAQYHQAVFPEMQGTTLKNNIVSYFKPISNMSYDVARDTLFGLVYKENDSLECVYTGFKVALPSWADPSGAAYQNGAGINTEHCYPQSLFGGNNNPVSDMHHLFPTRVDVNAARGNDRFADIPDNQTDTWYYLDQNQSSTPPSSIIDRWSEDTNNAFEPRESFKGNIARAMFYFYTMYESEANAVDNTFFSNQVSTLCEWHYQDPTDAKEWERTFKIANHQEGKPNPFVLDCSLANRIGFCQNVSSVCSTTPTSELLPSEISLSYFPNPTQGTLTIEYLLDKPSMVAIAVYDFTGKKVDAINVGRQATGTQTLELKHQGKGLFLVQFSLTQGENHRFHTQQVLFR